MKNLIIALSVHVLVTTLVACADSGDARLDHAQILAVRAEPAHIAPGETARIDILAGDDAGNVYEADPDSVTAIGAQGPLAALRTPAGWYVTAGAMPEIATLSVTLTIDGTAWPATKKLVIFERADNPRLDMQIDGSTATEMVARAGTKPQLTAVPIGSDPFTYAWYSSVGDLKYYRRPTAELDAAEVADGRLVLVVRDSVGGVNWTVLPARVE